jgi:DNA-binding NtrC family response regulator
LILPSRHDKIPRNNPMLCLTARYKDDEIRIPLRGDEGRLGYSSDNDYILPFPGISKVHAFVVRQGSAVHLRDLGSRNGLLVDGRRVEEVTLKQGDTVQIGRALVILGDATTSGFEIGLKLKGRASTKEGVKRHSTLDGASSGVHSPAGAMRLIRAMEKGSPDQSSRVPEILSHLRSVLDADAVVLVTYSRRELAIQAGSGAIPPQRAFEGLPLARVVSGEPARTSRDLDGGHRASAGWNQKGVDHVLVAFFGCSARHVAAWERELLSYVASKLADAAGVRPPPPAPVPENELKIPKGMVVGESPAMRKLLSQMRATVRSRMDVLLTGETGTGKELFARLIHDSGLYAKGPFVAINCASIPSDLLESQLFGIHARVATGVDPHAGLLMQAEGGAIFLDEIGELAEPLQAKLLRFLQEREIHPLGAPAPRKLDVLVISSSNRDLGEAVRKGTFRADLYYRLRGLQFHIPPLRDRKEDIPGLVLELASEAAEEAGKSIEGVSRRALDLLMAYDWPGNVRELQSEVRRAVLVCPSGSLLTPDHFGPVRWAVEKTRADEDLKPSSPTPPEPAETARPPEPPAGGTKLQEQIEAVERKAIQNALAATGGNKSKAADLLGVTRAGLAMKMRRLLVRDSGKAD